MARKKSIEELKQAGAIKSGRFTTRKGITLTVNVRQTSEPDQNSTKKER